MKKLIVEEVNLFRSEVRAAARTNQNRQCVLQFRVFFYQFLSSRVDDLFAFTQVDNPIA
jgi:hypothetical protein